MWACGCYAMRLSTSSRWLVTSSLLRSPAPSVKLQPVQDDAISARTQTPSPHSDSAELRELHGKCLAVLQRDDAPRVVTGTGAAIYFRGRQAVVDCARLPNNGSGGSDSAETSAINAAAVAKRLQPMTSVEDSVWKEQRALSAGELLSAYSKLSKASLTALVVITAAGGYAMAPGAFSPATFLLSSAGTTLMSCAANSVNQFFEVPYDAQMNRTKDRVIVRGVISPLHALTFAAVCGTVGFSTLYFGVNALTALLGLTNLLLYTMVYTPMKRLSIVNTWLGSFVGAIPPMMGWAACTGTLDIGAIWLAAVMYSWQFPHFNALSWNLRADYSRAGYRMTCVTDPALCRRVALRHSVIITALCLGAPAIDVTTWMFAVDSLPLNGYLVYLSWRFNARGDSASSRKLFRFSLIHIPALMLLMFIGKKRSADTAAHSATPVDAEPGRSHGSAAMRSPAEAERSVSEPTAAVAAPHNSAQ